MNKAGNSISRRSFMGAIGTVAVGLPFIESRAEAGADGVQRLLFASVHTLGDFHKKKGETLADALEQGFFVYDVKNGHKLLKKFPAKSWNSWSGGWSGLAAHAGSSRLFQVQDGDAVRAYDFDGKLLWETSKMSVDRAASEPDEAKRRALFGRGITYIDRRFGVTKDGRHILIPDRDSAKTNKDNEGERGAGVPVVRVLDASTGQWVKNISLIDVSDTKDAPVRGSPHNVHVMRKYIYASMWSSGHIFCIDPATLEVVRKIGPVEMGAHSEGDKQGESDAIRAGREQRHSTHSIQHFSVDPAERYVFVEPVPAFGIGVIEIASGKFVGQWPIPDAEPGTLRARRMANAAAKGNQLHSKRNHGIAYRPGSSEVWMTDDNWGLLHVWDVSNMPPKYAACVPVFDDETKPVFDFSWVNFSIDGKYAYASNKVIDATSRKIVSKLNGLNEASIEVQFKDGKVVRTGHEMGSGLDTWIEGFDIDPAGAA